MPQVGDTVRYLSASGGGKITRIVGKTAYVEEDSGFEMPSPLSELVVVQAAGSRPEASRASLYFDQRAFDEGRSERRAEPPSKEIPSERPAPAPKPLPPAPDTPHGNRLSIALAFEPSNIRDLDRSRFTALLVNDSNYTLLYTLSRRGEDEKTWRLVSTGTAMPNEMAEMADIERADLPGWHQVALQYVAYRPEGGYELKSPGSVARRLDLTKFYKAHTFRPGRYFTTPVHELQLVSDDLPCRPLELGDAARQVAPGAQPEDRRMVRELSAKYRVDSNRRQRRREQDPAANPARLLPLIEVDLHMGALTDSTAGLTNGDMLEMQLDRVRRTMAEHRRRVGQKIVFIHGKGDGVLRRAVTDLLRRQWPNAELQDASFAEYGFGATLVTIHSQPQKP